jgi:hypothetical protein
MPSASPNSLPGVPGCRYDSFMQLLPKLPHRPHPVLRLFIEVAFIVFLFYSNLLMGEFNGIAGKGKTLALALHDIFTPTNFAIALISALIGYVVFELLRKML